MAPPPIHTLTTHPDPTRGCFSCLLGAVRQTLLAGQSEVMEATPRAQVKGLLPGDRLDRSGPKAPWKPLCHLQGARGGVRVPTQHTGRAVQKVEGSAPAPTFGALLGDC